MEALLLSATILAKVAFPVLAVLLYAAAIASAAYMLRDKGS